MTYDLIIIGAGQAGLALGYYLLSKPLKYVILDAEGRIGDNWRKRYDSLKLFTPRAYSALPGLTISGDQDGYPSKDEVGDYLEKYGTHFDLPILLNKNVKKVSQTASGFEIVTNKGTYHTKHVVVATGAFQKPFIPPLASELPSTMTQVHSSNYRNSDNIPDGAVLVVGGGNSGAQIAVELARKRKVFLSLGHKTYPIQARIGPKSIFYWLDKIRLLNFIMNKPTKIRLGKYIFVNQKKIIMGTELTRMIRDGDVMIKPRLIHYKDGEFLFDYDLTAQAKTVIWATGFRQDFHWITVPEVIDKTGQPIHTRGVTNVPGFYFLGLPGLYSLGSAHLGWVKEDAEYIACQIKSLS